MPCSSAICCATDGRLIILVTRVIVTCLPQKSPNHHSFNRLNIFIIAHLLPRSHYARYENWSPRILKLSLIYRKYPSGVSLLFPHFYSDFRNPLMGLLLVPVGSLYIADLVVVCEVDSFQYLTYSYGQSHFIWFIHVSYTSLSWCGLCSNSNVSFSNGWSGHQLLDFRPFSTRDIMVKFHGTCRPHTILLRRGTVWSTSTS